MALPPEARAPRKRVVRKKPGTSSGGGGGPQGTGRIKPARIRAPLSPRKKRVKAPTKKQVTNAKAQEQGYVSQGKAVEKAGNQQRRVRLAKGQQEGYVSQAQAVEREARKRTGRGVILRAAKKELEGKGDLAKGLGKLGDLVERTAVLQSTGGGPGGVIASQKLTGHKLGPGAATALAPKPIKVEGTAAGRALKDFVNLPATAIPSVYEPVAGAVEAAQGRPERLKRIAKNIDESDPVYNLGAALVEAVQGDHEAAQKRLKRAEDAASEHPGLTALEVTGAARGVTGAAGRVGRTGVAGKMVKRVVSTDRESRTVPGTGLVERRDYHPDPLIKAAQVIGEKIHKPEHIPDREIRRRVDEAVAVGDEQARNRRGTDLEPLEDLGTGVVLRDFGAKKVEDLPKVARDRLEEHALSRTGGPKTLKVANRAFRETVLSTSPKWLAGNVIEGLGRAALNHAGPRSYVTGRKVMKRLETITPDKAEEAAARMIGGGHMASVKRQRVSVSPDYWKGTNIAPVADALGKFWRAPGPKQAAGFWHGWTELVMRQVNGRFETAVQTAMLGKAVRKSELMDGQILKLGKEAIEQAADGLTETAQQVRFGREVDRAYGRYSKLKPGERQWIASYTPFIRWYLNSIDFMVRTLPRDHPVVLALIAQAEIATDEWRAEHGLDKFVDGALPDWLQGSIPTEGGGHQRASQFTPFGAFSDFTGTAAGQLTPLLSSVASALAGQNWTGQALRVEAPNGKMRNANEIERAVAAAHEFLKATVPFLSVGERVSEKGPRSLDPFKDVQPYKPKTKKLRRSSSKAGTIVGPGSSGGRIVGPGATDVFGRSTSGSSSDDSFYGGTATDDDSTFFGN